MADSVGDMAGSYASAVSDYAGDAMSAVSEQSRDFARQAQSSFETTTEYVLERQPLAVAIIGIATGAAAAAAFRPTESNGALSGRQASGSAKRQARSPSA